MYNVITKKAYTGENAEILACSEFSKPYFLTYKQAQSINLQVRKGERGIRLMRVIEVDRFNKVTKKLEKKKLPKYFTVFNIEQCEEIKQEVAA